METVIRELQGDISQHSPWLVEGDRFQGGRGLKEGTQEALGWGSLREEGWGEGPPWVPGCREGKMSSRTPEVGGLVEEDVGTEEGSPRIHLPNTP